MAYIAKGLQALGALALLLAVGISIYIAYAFASNSDKTNTASKSDVLFVLNWGGLKSDQEYKVLSSFTSARSLTGDHLDYYCIQIADFSPSDFAKNDWHPISALEGTAHEAATQALSNGETEKCFGVQEAKDVMVYIWSATIHSLHVTAYDVILFDPKVKRLLYVSSKT